MTAFFKNNSDCCQNKKRGFLWLRAMIPAIFSCCALVCFAIVYWLVTARAINPLYFLGLIFILPALALGLIALLAGKDKLDAQKTFIYTIIIVPVSIIVSFYLIFIIGMSQTSAIVTSVSRYERTMKLVEYNKKENLAVFPEKIPYGAKNILFYYNKSEWQEYSQTIFLQFLSDQETIKGYIERFKKLAIQDESIDSKRVFDRVGDAYIKDLPADYTVYVIIYEGGHNRKVCAVSISQERNDVIFYAYEMRW